MLRILHDDQSHSNSIQTTVPNIIRYIYHTLIHTTSSTVKVKVTLWPMVSWTVSQCQAIHGAQEKVYVTVRQLQFCWFGVPSPMRGWACHISVIVSSTCHLHLITNPTQLHTRNTGKKIPDSAPHHEMPKPIWQTSKVQLHSIRN
jgi:hypothetical protein